MTPAKTSKAKNFCAVVVGVPALLLALTSCFLLPSAPEVAPSATVEPPADSSIDAAFEPPEFPYRIPNQCSTILQRDVVAEVLEVPVKSVTLVEEPLDYAAAVTVQGGGLTCVWTGTNAAGKGSAELTVHILLGAETDYDIYVAHNPAAVETSLPDHVEDAIGENSQFSCTVKINRQCSGIFEKWGTWVEFTFGGPVTVAGSVDATDAVSIGEHILRALNAASSSYVYEVPAGYLREWSDCAQLDPDGSYLSDLGSPSLVLDESTDGVDLEAITTKRARAASCRWSNAAQSGVEADELSGLEASILPGGEWAWSDFLATAISQQTSASETIPGATQAISWCSDDALSSDCSVVALVDHSILSVTAYGSPEGSRDVREAAVDAMRYLIERL